MHYLTYEMLADKIKEVFKIDISVRTLQLYHQQGKIREEMELKREKLFDFKKVMKQLKEENHE